mgnify:CR=1 FL=1
MDILLRFLVAVLYCVAIGLVAWGVTALIGLIPMLPAFLKSALTILVIVVAGVACIIILVNALSGGSLMLVSF